MDGNTRNASKRVFCIGELLIDFICKDVGTNLVQGNNFEKKAGGAPANVAAAITKLEGHAYFLGKVGNDPFGVFLENTLKEVNVDTSMLIKGGNTTLAFVSIDSKGERDFKFCRGADGEYSFDDIDFLKMKKGDIIHFGSATGFLDGELRNTYFKLLEYAKENKMFISFDPNYRDALIKDTRAFAEDSIKFIEKSDFVKLSDEEAMIITGKENLEECTDEILRMGAKTVCITLGSKGTLLATKEKKVIVPSIKIKQVDSTGAGDAFVGAILYQIAKGEDNLEFDTIFKYVEFANVVGAITCMNFGAICSMPTGEDVKKSEENKY
ncbi:carbohydrate kinase [Clostridium algoriphilum]|uniref:carbohydrate kinase family protein n=1 Tax=Clostridium algoriphilum TaxID=198347 RepID=UPI001CF41772|nr:carbohydrate kinase [Clostridium algoriphilum]MCB2294404.1 carbohydrate kinase [Clostridium algoriphilum]